MTTPAVWAMFYASVMGMGLHPGTTRDGAPKLTTEQAAKIADDMMIEFNKRFTG